MEKIISALKQNLSHLIENEAKELKALNSSIDPIQDEIDYFENNWAGGWLRQDYNVYSIRRNTYEINEKYIFEHILTKTGIDFNKIQSDIKNKAKAFRQFNNDLIADLAFIKDEDKFKNELPLLEELEKYEWYTSPSDIISILRPNNLPVYDMRQLSQGILNPPHIAVKAYYLSLVTECGSCNIYIEKAKRLIRQIEVKIGYKKTNTADEILTSILNNFHQFAKQLRNRHNNRNTIEIEDEYDVQDLMHSILKLHFVDVREEEYTPSYAGSSTRMDFLLKNEQIVIEVKKTRNSLKDKEVGEQLILDIAHYKNHPNCSTLYCFVYDPESKIKNSKGLENDLSKQSTENLDVKVFIRP